LKSDEFSVLSSSWSKRVSGTKESQMITDYSDDFILTCSNKVVKEGDGTTFLSLNNNQVVVNDSFPQS
jgi:hypothetical protein